MYLLVVFGIFVFIMLPLIFGEHEFIKLMRMSITHTKDSLYI